MQTLTLSSPQMSLLASGAPTQSQTSPSGSVKSADLLKGSKTLAIEHNGAVYRLQTTKLGKLILTK